MKKERLTKLGQFFRLNFVGLLVGFLLYCFALTPSLLPRPPIFEGVIAGLSFAVGYGLGVLLSWAIRRVTTKEIPLRVKRYTWRITLGIVTLAAIMYCIWATSWQNTVRQLIGETELASQHVLTIIGISFLTATVIILFARLIYRAIYSLSEFAERWLPRRVSFAVGTLLIGLLLVWFYNGVLLKTFITVSNNMYRSANNETKPGVQQPTIPYRSGSPGSLAAWDTLGRMGRSFVADGPNGTQLETFNGAPALDPIRIYIGLQSKQTVAERADLAVAEMERTGAFSREVIAIITATGTGWIEPQTADALEYIWNGNTALVSMQYSYLPSWISFMVDQENSIVTSRALFDAVYKKWQSLPSNSRPKLLTYGLSLGSYGAQAMFSGIEDIQNRTDGALFVGSPNRSQLLEHFTANRDKGSPEWQPIYQGGATVRFAANSADLSKPDGKWETPRIIFMQHASDPVAWWSPDLIWHEPDWLMEPRGSDVTPIMQWYPFVTFFQVTVDQFFGTFVPPGHGHNYSDSIVAAWASLAAPSNWNSAKAEQLQAIINTRPTEHN